MSRQPVIGVKPPLSPPLSLSLPPFLTSFYLLRAPYLPLLRWTERVSSFSSLPFGLRLTSLSPRAVARTGDVVLGALSTSMSTSDPILLKLGLRAKETFATFSRCCCCCCCRCRCDSFHGSACVCLYVCVDACAFMRVPSKRPRLHGRRVKSKSTLAFRIFSCSSWLSFYPLFSELLFFSSAEYARLVWERMSALVPWRSTCAAVGNEYISQVLFSRLLLLNKTLGDWGRG